MKQPRYLEFEFDGENYRTDRIGAEVQIAIVLKLGSVLPTFMKLARYKSDNPTASLMDLDAGPMAILGEGMAAIPDASRDFVIAKMMGAVQKQQGPGWMPIWNAQDKTFAYDDIDLRVMINLGKRVFDHNLASFTKALGLNLTGPAAA